jgi:hypothetical protein
VYNLMGALFSSGFFGAERVLDAARTAVAVVERTFLQIALAVDRRSGPLGTLVIREIYHNA